MELKALPVIIDRVIRYNQIILDGIESYSITALLTLCLLFDNP